MHFKLVCNHLARCCVVRAAILNLSLLYLSLLCLSLVLAVQSCAPVKVLPPPSGGETLVYHPPKPQEWVLDNGLKVLYLEDRELPLVRGALFVKGGSHWADADSYGVYELLGPMLRSGGAGDLDADALDNRLEELAAKISSSMTGEYGSVSFECLEGDTAQVFGLFSDVVLRPRFAPERLKLLQGQLLEAISRRKDDPWTTAALSFKSMVYGETPLGRSLNSADVLRVNPRRLKQAYYQFLKPERAVLVISGRISFEKVQQLLGAEFVHLRRGEIALPVLTPKFPAKQAQIVFVPANVAQATIIAGQRGVPPFTADHFPILLYNEIFSGGMSSLLFSKVRSELGLAYSVFGAIAPGFIEGRNLLAIQTKAESAGEALLAALTTLQQTREQEVPASLLNEKRMGMSAAYVFSHASPWDILTRRVSLELAGYPEDYDDRYLDQLQAASSTDVLEVARKRWDPAKFVIVLVGNEQAYVAMRKIQAQLPSPYNQLSLKRAKFDESLSF